MQSAVALIIFNRPDTTARVVAALSQARPPTIHIIADGPRPHKLGEDVLCARARAAAENIDWPCRIVKHYSDTNLGCQQRVFTGISAVLAEHDRVIVVEDDCVAHPDFFPFCEEMLETYKDDPRISVVSGDSFACATGGLQLDSSYVFSRYPHIWGWATWARAWNGFDPKLPWWNRGYRGLAELPRLIRHTGSFHEALYWCMLIEMNFQGRLNSWGLPWVMYNWRSGSLAIYPAVNMVSNIGFGAQATHTGAATDPVANLPAMAMPWPLRAPSAVAADATIDDWTARTLYSGPRRRCWRRLRRYLKLGRRANV